MITEDNLAEWERAAHADGPWAEQIAAGAVPVLIAEVRRLRAALGEPQVIETPAGASDPPAIIFSSAPAVSTPEELAAVMGWSVYAAKDFLSRHPPQPVAIYKIDAPLTTTESLGAVFIAREYRGSLLRYEGTAAPPVRDVTGAPLLRPDGTTIPNGIADHRLWVRMSDDRPVPDGVVGIDLHMADGARMTHGVAVSCIDGITEFVCKPLGRATQTHTDAPPDSPPDSPR